MINLKALKRELQNSFGLSDKNIIIKRKKKMVLITNGNGDVKTKRVNVVRVEIIE